MTDRELFEKALKEMSQREGLTSEERKRRCGELLVQAQYMDSKEYLRWMHDSTKRPWVGLTRAERFEIEKAMSQYYDYRHECKTVCLPEFAAAIEAKLKEKNT